MRVEENITGKVATKGFFHSVYRWQQGSISGSIYTFRPVIYDGAL